MNKSYLKYKNYAHFDKRMSVSRAKRLLKDNKVIKDHGFFPFVHYTIISKRIEKFDNKIHYNKEPKKREIYYCAHFDRYIYQHYAYKIGLLYNKYVFENEIDNCVGAYRINKGKCNIDFSYEMFTFVKNNPNCFVIIGDFSSFFDNLNHQNLKNRLEIVLGSKMDDNLYKTFLSLTNFKYVNVDDLYDYYSFRNNKRSEKYYMRKLKQLMDVSEFRSFIKMKNSKTNLSYLKYNEKDYGIVQGSPMSGLLANIYMIDFDKQMNEFVRNQNGKYLRYSDDFMIVIPFNDNIDLNNVYKKVQEYVGKAGKIELQKKKTNVYQYSDEKVTCLNKNLFNTDNTANVISFLGFSFDGVNISLRQKTLSKYSYKLNRKIKKYFNGSSDDNIKDIYDKFSIQGSNKTSKKGFAGNFITYVKRAKKIYGNEPKIAKVINNSKKKVTERIGIIKSRNKS